MSESVALPDIAKMEEWTAEEVALHDAALSMTVIGLKSSGKDPDALRAAKAEHRQSRAYWRGIRKALDEPLPEGDAAVTPDPVRATARVKT